MVATEPEEKKDSSKESYQRGSESFSSFNPDSEVSNSPTKLFKRADSLLDVPEDKEGPKT